MCGGLLEEHDHFAQNRHSFSEYRFPNGTEMVLCEICFLDIGSVVGEHWGRNQGSRLTTNDLVLVRQVIWSHMTRDRYCPVCDTRLAYLKALREIRDGNSKEDRFTSD